MSGIIMLTGLPGSGKSWLAERLNKGLPDSTVLKTVNYRPLVSRSSIEFFDEENEKTRKDKDNAYWLMIEEARKIANRRVVILDGTFHKSHRRKWVYALARERGVPIAVVSVTCPEQIIAKRIAKRDKDLSKDAVLKSMSAFTLMKCQADPLTEIVNYEVFNSVTGNLDSLFEKVKQFLDL